MNGLIFGGTKNDQIITAVAIKIGDFHQSGSDGRVAEPDRISKPSAFELSENDQFVFTKQNNIGQTVAIEVA